MSKARHSVKTSRGHDAGGARWAATVEAHRQAQQDLILDAVIGLLGERGIAGLTMSALAERAGVSRATVYHYFADVDQVLAAWASREVRRSVAGLIDHAAQLQDPLERLRWLLDEQLEHFAGQDHRLSVEHLESEAGSPTLRVAVAGALEPMRQLLASTLESLAANDQFHFEGNIELAVDMIFGLLAAARRHLAEGRLSPTEASATLWGLLVRGWLGPGAAGSDDRRASAGQSIPREPTHFEA
jgi:AcrR family transcriptional regulator